MMKRILMGGAGLLALSLAPQAAFTADMPVHPPVAKAPVAAPIFDWTGPYVGIAGGWAWAKNEFRFSNGTPASGPISRNGAIIGGTLGNNWQSGPWIYGIEGDLSWTDLGKQGPGVFPFCTGALAGFTCSSDVEWLGTVRGRLGYTINPSLLLYATGGLAVAGIHNQFWFVSKTTEKAGWTAGVGIEGVLAPNWTWKAEYLHARFGNTPTGCTPTSVPTNCTPEVVSDPTRINIVRVGINYRFATGKAPAVVTKY